MAMLVQTKLAYHIYIVRTSLFQARYEQLGTMANHGPLDHSNLLIVGLGNPGKHYHMTRWAGHFLFAPTHKPFNHALVLN